MLQFLRLPAAERLRMGRTGRRKMERQFDERIVIEKYLDAIDGILAERVRKTT
jgi:hypothetical protein